MPPININNQPNEGAHMSQKHTQINLEDRNMLAGMYKEKVGVNPNIKMSNLDIEKALEDVEAERSRLLEETREEERAGIKKYHHA